MIVYRDLIRFVFLYACIISGLTASGFSQQVPGAACYELDDYEKVLDAYFAHARGNSSSLVALRVYGGLLPEYELVFDPDGSKHSVFWYTPKKSIWGDAYDDYADKHRSVQDYVSRALKIPFTKREIEISEPKFADFFGRAASIDASICEHLPLRDAKGGQHLIEDAPWLELIRDGGRNRVKVTDTSDFKEIVSQNPALLEWATDVQKILRDHLRASIH